ncbi:uncharacterized protein LOC122498870 isoform X2 [Leptopilina heterotoma]|nr:uncharacterized protein LOC122498870 isoform X2 [Leptopilina heterotoma]XP_043462791.1 uncharacterized protein LOC122498870 isoform X2 [Leptopilina heterotoma]XP_043462792.1 uncharacterized protein LOC122498870 isoform X2 [Leptopilina heterotoma]
MAMNQRSPPRVQWIKEELNSSLSISDLEALLKGVDDPVIKQEKAIDDSYKINVPLESLLIDTERFYGTSKPYVVKNFTYETDSSVLRREMSMKTNEMFTKCEIEFMLKKVVDILEKSLYDEEAYTFIRKIITFYQKNLILKRDADRSKPIANNLGIVLYSSIWDNPLTSFIPLDSFFLNDVFALLKLKDYLISLKVLPELTLQFCKRLRLKVFKLTNVISSKVDEFLLLFFIRMGGIDRFLENWQNLCPRIAVSFILQEQMNCCWTSPDEELIRKYFSNCDLNRKLLRQILINLMILNIPLNFNNVTEKEKYNFTQIRNFKITNLLGPIFQIINTFKLQIPN